MGDHIFECSNYPSIAILFYAHPSAYHSLGQSASSAIARNTCGGCSREAVRTARPHRSDRGDSDDLPLQAHRTDTRGILKITIDPEVESGATLRDSLLAKEIDVMVAGVIFRDEHFKMMAVGESRLHWMCKPGLETGERKPLRIQVLQNYRSSLRARSQGRACLSLHSSRGCRSTRASLNSRSSPARAGSGNSVRALPRTRDKPYCGAWRHLTGRPTLVATSLRHSPCVRT